MGNINVYDKIMIKIQEKEKIWKANKFFLQKSPFNRWFKNGIYSMLSRADARGNAV